MGARKIKIPQKSAAAMEDTSGFLEKAQEWGVEHFRPLVAAVVAVLVISASYIGFNAYKESGERTAQNAYARAMSLWPQEGASQNGDLDPAISALKKVVQKHGSTRTALNARMDLVKACFRQERYEDALKLAREVLDLSGSDHELEMLARYHLALAYQQLGKLDEALQGWQAMEGDEALPLDREIQWRLGRIHSLQEDYEQAVKHYEQALETNGSYPEAPLIEDELAASRHRIQGDGAREENSAG